MSTENLIKNMKSASRISASLSRMAKTATAPSGIAAGDGSLQPLGSAADVESAVCEDIKARQRRGIAKYGTTVAANPLSQREWLTHAYEETLDLAVYLKKIIDGTQPPNGRGEPPLTATKGIE